jgi:molybdenum cofactor cytidylyltransferase
MRDEAPVAAIVLAAGQSRRMGEFKQLLPLGPRRVVEWVVAALMDAGLAEIVVVTGHRRDEVEAAVAAYPVRFAFNPDYAGGEMLSSIQVGLRALGAEAEAAILALGDQPQLQIEAVKAILKAYRREGGGHVYIPIYEGRRGHPICLPRSFWAGVLALPWTASLRDFLRERAGDVVEVPVTTASILRDMDTVEDYERELLHLWGGLYGDSS